MAISGDIATNWQSDAGSAQLDDRASPTTATDAQVSPTTFSPILSYSPCTCWACTCSVCLTAPAPHLKICVPCTENGVEPAAGHQTQGGAHSAAVLSDGMAAAGMACAAACTQRSGPPAPPMRGGLANPGARVPPPGLCAEGRCGDLCAGLSSPDFSRGGWEVCWTVFPARHVPLRPVARV